jgi:phage-related protein
MNYVPTSKIVYIGKEFCLEFYQSRDGAAPAERWLESQKIKVQQKFAALFVWIGDHGALINEMKFKHLAGSDQIFEFKVDDGRVLCFFFAGGRLILTHGFLKKRDKTPSGEIRRAESIKADFIRREKT